MKNASCLLTFAALNAILTISYTTMVAAADQISPVETCIECSVRNVMSYTGQGTSSARASGGGLSFTADCTVGRMVDQYGRAYKVDRSARSAVEALGFIDGRAGNLQDQRSSDTDLVSNYWSMCPLGASGTPSSESSSSAPSGGGGSSSGSHSTTSASGTVVTQPGVGTVSRPNPVLVDTRGGGGGGGGNPGGGGTGHNVGVPFPVAGIGLPALLLAGGYVMLRRRRRSQPT